MCCNCFYLASPLTFPLKQVCLNFYLSVWSFDLVMERNAAFHVLSMKLNQEFAECDDNEVSRYELAVKKSSTQYRY